MTRIVIDITTTWRWDGHDVGITRTERELAVRLLGDPLRPGLTAVAVRRLPGGRFAIVERADALSRLHREGPVDGEIPSAIPGPPGRGARATDAMLRAGKRTAVAAYRGTERLLPEPAHGDLRAAGVHALRTARLLVHQRRHPNFLVLLESWEGTAWDGAGPDDVYVSMGLDWDDKNLAQLWTLRRQHGFRCVLMCYDLIPSLFPHLIPSDPALYDSHFCDLLHTADAVCAISETTAQSLRELATRSGLPTPPVHTVRLGADFNMNDPVPVRLGGRPFVLFVSTVEPRKNHRLLLEVWRRLSDRMTSPPLLVVAGRRGWQCDDVFAAMESDLRLRRNVRHVDTPSDRELAWLYRNCLFTVFPSIYEGWGLPVVESMLAGKLCVASTAGAVVEAGAGSAIHIDVLDGCRWVEVVEELAGDPVRLAEASVPVQAAGAKIRSTHTWSAFADEIRRIAGSVASYSPSASYTPS
jgi:glycosyltransferase involved in cell wall biosynthesis